MRSGYINNFLTKNLIYLMKFNFYKKKILL